jgi:uncharacterized protein YjdB
MTTGILLLAITACSTDAIPTAPAGPEQNRLVSSVKVVPSDALMAPDEAVRLDARVFSARGQQVNGRPVEWSSSDESVALVDGNGSVVAVNEGSATISANVLGVVGKATIDVRGEVVGIEVESPTELAAGSVAQLSAIFVYSNGARRQAGKLKWDSDNPGVAVVDADGELIARNSGTTLVTAAGRGKQGKKWLEINPVPVASVTIAPSAPVIGVGESLKLDADVRDGDGNRLYRDVSWSSSNEAVAWVNSNGVLHGRGDGLAVISATAGGVSGVAEAVVGNATPNSGSGDSGSGSGDGGGSEPAAPGAVTDLSVVSSGENTVTLRFTEVDDGTGVAAKYSVRYADGSLGWSWGDAIDVTSGSCATPLLGQSVGSTLTCTVEGLQPSTRYDFQLVAYRGTFNVDAVFGPPSNLATGTTQDPPLVVDVIPSTLEVEVGQQRVLEAQVTDAYGNPVQAPVTWSTTRSSVASVDQTGTVTGQSTGDATISASAQESSDLSSVAVTSAPTSDSGSGGGSGDGGSGGGSDWGGAMTPNEPAGFTKVSDQPFDALTGDSWTIVSAPNASIISDASAPASAPNVFRCTFPGGLAGGGGDQCRLSRGIRYQGSYQEIYISYWIKLSSNWQGHSSGVNKTTYIQAGAPNAEPTFDAHGSGSNPLRPQITSNASSQADCGVSGVLSLQPNVGSAEIRRGEWVLIEVYLKLNTPGSCDGAAKWWHNGRLVMDHPNISILPAGSSPWNWRKINHDPIWGGTGDQVRQTMTMDIDHYYISGR